MRLNLWFLALLILATVSSGLELREFPLARDGDALARGIVFAAAAGLAISVVLLVRIVSRIEDVKRAGKEVRR